MSRSYRKKPCVKDHTTSKYGKQQANKKVRREKTENFNGKDYRKAYDSWDIHDYIFFYSKEDAIKDWYDEEGSHVTYQHLHQKYGTLEKWLNAWKKMMLRK